MNINRMGVIFLAILPLLILAVSAQSQPLWEDGGNFRWDKVHRMSDSYEYVSKPLIDNGLAELKIRILTDGDFTFEWMKEGGDETRLRFFINKEEKNQCNDASLTQLRNSYSVKNGDTLKWLFTASKFGNWTAKVAIRTREQQCEYIINKPLIIKKYAGFPLDNNFFIASGGNCSQGGAPVVNLSAVDTDRPGNYSYSIRCGDSCPIETGIITILPLVLDVPSYSCVEQPGLEARVSEIEGANYYWSLSDGEITEGQGTSKIQWRSDNSNCDINVTISLEGIEKYLSRNVPINPNCIYLDHCDDLNGSIGSDMEIRLLCQPCGDRIGSQGKIIIENIHNLTICSYCPSQYATLDGFLEIGNSTDISISGLDIRSTNVIINADNLSNSNIFNNKINPNSRSCAIFLNNSTNNILLNNDIRCNDNNNSIVIFDGKNNTINCSLDHDKILERTFSEDGNLLKDITCWIDNDCYTCMYSNETIVDLKNYTKQNWEDLHDWSPYCSS